MSEIVIYQSTDNEVQIEVQFEGETFWLSLVQIAELFGRDKSVISRHLKIFIRTESLRWIQLLQKMQQFNMKEVGKSEGQSNIIISMQFFPWDVR